MTLFPKDALDRLDEIIAREEKAYRDGILFAAEEILRRGVRFVFLAGPSCSGKSTTAFSLEKALEKAGKRVLPFSTDDYFFDQERAPKNPDGSPNYDAFSHTDSALILQNLHSISRGEITHLPSFDFVSGKRCQESKRVDPKEYDIFLLEGIHALNDVILQGMPEGEAYLCFYLDVTHSLQSEAGGGVFSPERIRFCRRLIRDFKHRGADAARTHLLWKNVIQAEKEILHPFRKNAFACLNSNFSYEIAVEKAELSALLSQVSPRCPLYPRAKRILEDLVYFPTLPESVVPDGSVLKEFIE